jgi:glyoxylase-like metal-dependent hydrolase (beta-lactamase superfamily II)
VSSGSTKHLPVPLAVLTEDADLIVRRIAPLPDGFLDPATMTFQCSNHSWFIRVDDLTVLVDPYDGNGRKRRLAYFDGLDLPYLELLAAAGTPADTIDIVFGTHMHNDHCGWDTSFAGPSSQRPQRVGVRRVHRPVVDAGQARLVAGTARALAEPDDRAGARPHRGPRHPRSPSSPVSPSASAPTSPGTPSTIQGRSHDQSCAWQAART